MDTMSDFRLLTMEEFSQLPRREKIAYLALAVEEAMKKGEQPHGDDLFADAPRFSGKREPSASRPSW